MTYGVFDVRADFGALGDNSADDTLPFQSAIDAAHAITEGGAVFVPPGRYYLSGIKMRSRVTLYGVGSASFLRLLPGVTTPLITLADNATNHTIVRDLRIRGNKFTGNGGLGAHGIHYVNSEDANIIRQATLMGIHGDPNHRIIDVTVEACAGDGVRLWTRATYMDRCNIAECEGNGLVLEGSDNWVTATQVNWIWKKGVVIYGGNNQLSQVKVWFIGTDPTFKEGDGFHVESSRNRLVNCEAQDTSRLGIHIRGGDNNHFSGFMLDNIGNLFKNQGVGFDQPPLSCAALVIKRTDGNPAAFNKLTFVLGQRSAISNIDSFVKFGNGSNNNRADFTGNPVHILTTAAVVRDGYTTVFNNVARWNNQEV